MSDVPLSSMTFLTPKQVAKMLHVSEATVSRWAAQDATFPVTRLPGRLVRIEQQALYRWLGLKMPRAARKVADQIEPALDRQSSAATLRVAS